MGRALEATANASYSMLSLSILRHESVQVRGRTNEAYLPNVVMLVT